MKYLLLLLPLTVFAQTRIEVFYQGKLVAGDEGENVTIESLNAKMPFDITEEKYQKVVTDVAAEKAAKEAAKQARLNRLNTIKALDYTSATPAQIGEILNFLKDEL